MAKEKKRKILSEFQEFINKGSVMDMAVGIIIGGAFTSIVTALTSSIINPFITLITGGGNGLISALVVPGTNIDFGAFISACINFLIISVVVFLMIKSINKAKRAAKKIARLDTSEYDPPTCPYCMEEIKEGATRCPHCAGSFDEPAAPKLIKK